MNESIANAAPTAPRPGGLTVIAVLDFLFSAQATFAAFGLVLLLLMVYGVVPMMSEEFVFPREAVEHLERFGIDWLWVLLIDNAFSAPLLLISGIGCLRQSHVFGKVVGTVYAILQLACAVLLVAVAPEDMRLLFLLPAFGMLLYPTVQVILLHTVFGAHFHR